jgi:hypothetical protein
MVNPRPVNVVAAFPATSRVPLALRTSTVIELGLIVKIPVGNALAAVPSRNTC